MFDFPASPANGQIFTPPGGPSYRFQSPVWTLLASGIGEAPVDGQLYGRQNGAWGLVNPLAMPNGAVIDSAFASNGANADMGVLVPIDDTIPQITEGSAVFNLSITPKSVTNKLRCRFRGTACGNVVMGIISSMFVNSATNAVAANYVSCPAGYSVPLALEHEFVPGATTLQTVQIRVGPSTGIMRMNGNTASRMFGGTCLTTLVIEEIKA